MYLKSIAGISATQLDAVFDDLEIVAVKVGMLFSSSIIETVAEKLAGKNVPIILDPVMVSTSGHSLLNNDAVSSLQQLLIPVAEVITPNLPEAAKLLGKNTATDKNQMFQQAQELLSFGCKAALVKGGHAENDQCIDVFASLDESTFSWTVDRVETLNTHGTGCTFSSGDCS